MIACMPVSTSLLFGFPDLVNGSLLLEHITKYALFVARFIMNFDAYNDGVTMLY